MFVVLSRNKGYKVILNRTCDLVCFSLCVCVVYVIRLNGFEIKTAVENKSRLGSVMCTVNYN